MNDIAIGKRKRGRPRKRAARGVAAEESRIQPAALDPAAPQQPLKPDSVYLADSVGLLNAWEPGWADLVFADPPFNIGYTYDVYEDEKPYEHYVDWTRQWMAACKRALKPTGSFYIAIGDYYAAEVRMIGRDLGLTLRNWIIWHYTFGQNNRKKFCLSHAHIFYFVCDPKHFTFNDRQIRFPSARHTVYHDRRGNPLGRLPDDTWDEFPRVCGTFKERAGWHGCQMPEALLARIIRASSNEGDTVLDPFAGSGTTLAAAAKLGRHYVGIDISPDYVRQCQARLKEAVAVRVGTDNLMLIKDLDWPPLDEEALVQLYRDTQVPIETLAEIQPAMRCFLLCLQERTGKPHTRAAVLEKLRQLARQAALPPIPTPPTNGRRPRGTGG
jgi:DNA modification methylase